MLCYFGCNIANNIDTFSKGKAILYVELGLCQILPTSSHDMVALEA